MLTGVAVEVGVAVVVLTGVAVKCGCRGGGADRVAVEVGVDDAVLTGVAVEVGVAVVVGEPVTTNWKSSTKKAADPGCFHT